MDYKMYKNYKERDKLIENFLNKNNYKIDVTTPSNLLKKLK